MLNINKVYIQQEDILYKKLLKIPGIGPKRAKTLINYIGIHRSCKLMHVSLENRTKLLKFIEFFYSKTIGMNLLEKTQENITYYSTINSYRGIRHKYGLPVRGQNTRTNARTRKCQKRKKTSLFFRKKRFGRDIIKVQVRSRQKKRRSPKKKTGKVSYVPYYKHKPFFRRPKNY